MIFSSAITEVNVDLGNKSYPIYIGENILPDLGKYLKKPQMGLATGTKIMVVTNPLVYDLYGRTVMNSLAEAGFTPIPGEVPDGEAYKTLDSAEHLYDVAFDNGLDRKSVVLALGGGVIGDLAGFVAATYMRGVSFIQVPTTLLAQVDSSVGGKVAVNHPRGKNIIGAFYQPKMVFTDIRTLHTLAQREFRAGMAEVIKYGVIWDRKFFDFLVNEHAGVKNLNTSEVTRVISTSCSIKARVVEQDETEQDVRAILNYGHTFGHAYEALTNYKKFVHGEAVAIGMISAAAAAERLGMLSAGNLERINNIIRLYGLPENFGALAPEEIIASMGHDKKAVGGNIKYILPEDIGRVKIVSGIDNDVLTGILSQQV